MTKSEFLSLLRDRLSALPREDAEERLGFYAEMIDDRIEEGLSEEEAVAAVGSVDRIASQILSETMSEISKKSKKPKEKRKMKTWEIVLLAAGSPVWLSLLIALFAVIISLYAVMWSLVASAWSVFGALIGSAIGVIFVGAVSIIVGDTLVGLAALGAGLFIAGLSIFGFIGGMAVTKGGLFLTGRIFTVAKGLFIKKEAA